MNLEQAKKLITELQGSKRYRKYAKRGRKAERYAHCKNDIEKKTRGASKTDFFKKANHKISSRFFPMILMQKSSYLFGTPVEIDVGDETINAEIKEILGPQWGKNLKRLCDVVSMWGDGWIQYWINEAGEFKYGVIDHSEEVMSVWGGTLDEQLLLAVKQTINWVDPYTGEAYNLYEVWTDTECSFYMHESTGDIDELRPELRPLNFDVSTESFDNTMNNEFGEVPFVYFRNNSMKTNDLDGIKGEIDSFDEAASSLADDIADCDQILFILSNAGGQDAEEFWNNVNEDKLIKIVNDPMDGDAKSGLELLTVEPPIAAKKLAMEMAKDNIFNLGGCVNPTPEILGSTSGEALKHLYNILELKAMQLEDDFRLGINRLVKAILHYLGYELPPGQEIKQTWKRTRINNDTEIINNLVNSGDMLSQETKVKMHPYADPDELARLAQEKQRATQEAIAEGQTGLLARLNPYGNNTTTQLLGREVQDARGELVQENPNGYLDRS